MNRLSNRLTLDPSISTRYPRIRGSWITADLIVSLIRKRWTVDDIRMFHPELNREDVLACVTYFAERRTAQRKGV